MPKRLAFLSVVLLMFVWGSTFVITKQAAREIPPLTLAFARHVISAAVLLPIALWRGGLALLPRPLPLGTFLAMALTGISGFTVAFNLALVHGSASQGALIYAFVPAGVAIAARVLLRERQSGKRVIGIALSVAGIVIVALSGERSEAAPSPWLGTLWMLGAVLALSIYTVLAKRLAAFDQIAVTACVATIGALSLLPGALWELSRVPFPQPSAAAWWQLAFLAVIASALAYFVYGRALRELDASLVGALSNLDPIVGVLSAVLFLGETLHAGQTLGAVVALIGMWLASTEPSAVELPGSRGSTSR